MTTQLTQIQRRVLTHAARHTDGELLWFPNGIEGNARKKIVDALLSYTLIVVDGDRWLLTDAGYDAIGILRQRPPKTLMDAKHSIRNNTKQAKIIALMKRPKGATLAQICEATGWQPHTARGNISGTLKKKLLLDIRSEKTSDGDRVYRIIE